MSPAYNSKLHQCDETLSTDVCSPQADSAGPDLAIKLLEVTPKKQQNAYDYAGSIVNHPQLSHDEKQSLLWVLAQSPAFQAHIPSSIIDFHEMPEWVHCSSSRCEYQQYYGAHELLSAI